MTGHPLDAAIIQAIDNVIKREIAEADEVREEIKRSGTHRASDENLEAPLAGRCAPQATG